MTAPTFQEFLAMLREPEKSQFPLFSVAGTIQCLIIAGCRGHCSSLPLVLVVQWCLTLCDLRDYNPPGSSVHGILLARILEWVAIPFSRGSSQYRYRNSDLLHCRQILYCLSQLLNLPVGAAEERSCFPCCNTPPQSFALLVVSTSLEKRCRRLRKQEHLTIERTALQFFHFYPKFFDGGNVELGMTSLHFKRNHKCSQLQYSHWSLN